ncbi:MAG TPA: aldehyde dehydrogenase family protein [Planctomycetota bacterium]|nr:aldehyde dehydrogenase family protein [Planctomycetota bacterium]
MPTDVRSPLVAGKAAAGGAPRSIVHPHDGSRVATVADSTRATVEAALAAAERGAAVMRSLTSHERATILERATERLAGRAEELARTIALEAGKPLRDARVEAARCATTFRTAAEEARRIGGEVLPIDAVASGRGRTGITRRFPIGIVTAITPFNFPLNLAAHKVAPALAAGNSVCLKPAPRTPLSAFALADALLEAGCPREAISVLPGEPPAIDPLIDDPRVAMVSFTGSAAVGWSIPARAPRKRITLELGGNAAALVHRDADVDFAAERCVAGAFTYAGQVCIRAQRLLVHEEVAPRFVDAFVARAKALRRGAPLDEATEIGPMIDAAAAARAASWVDEALSRGADRVIGGPPEGAWFPPTVLRRVPPDAKASCEEIFAPVVTLETYRELDDAVARADRSRFGLQAGLFTNDLAGLLRAFERLHVGALVHNDVPMFRADPMPYGGVKDSGLGREGLRAAIESMTELRLLVLRPDPRA